MRIIVNPDLTGNEERDHSLHQCVNEITDSMARGDSRLGTWQVLLTISMVITPLSAHGKSNARSPTLSVRFCKRARTCAIQITPALAYYMEKDNCPCMRDGNAISI